MSLKLWISLVETVFKMQNRAFAFKHLKSFLLFKVIAVFDFFPNRSKVSHIFSKHRVKIGTVKSF